MVAGISIPRDETDKKAVQKARLMERETLTIMKACEVVGVSRRTIYNWISAGKVEYVRTAGGSIRIFADTLWRSSGHEAPAGVRSSEASAGSHA
jgi:excisionase family DNA binding protein